MDEPSLFIPLGRGVKRRTLSALTEENTARRAFVFFCFFYHISILYARNDQKASLAFCASEQKCRRVRSCNINGFLTAINNRIC